MSNCAPSNRLRSSFEFLYPNIKTVPHPSCYVVDNFKSFFFCVHIVSSVICSANWLQFFSKKTKNNPSKPHCGKTENAADLSALSIHPWSGDEGGIFFFLNKQVWLYKEREEGTKRKGRKRGSQVLYSITREVRRRKERRRSVFHFCQSVWLF